MIVTYQSYRRFSCYILIILYFLFYTKQKQQSQFESRIKSKITSKYNARFFSRTNNPYLVAPLFLCGLFRRGAFKNNSIKILATKCGL